MEPANDGFDDGFGGGSLAVTGGEGAERERAEREHAQEEFGYLLSSAAETPEDADISEGTETMGQGLNDQGAAADSADLDAVQMQMQKQKPKREILPGRAGSSIGCHKVPPLMEEHEWLHSFRQG